ncbi:dithiol-disulfide isomerase [Lentilactobacillus curieae]|uniref:Dithiol-disulfide isomerase n=1 Tax=Lentilactobacillus curieae TaxID=1138822 RepID=A0A1S6QG58_9LACO|nr:DsbA family protein [Lentilactobacillus curieae]AQW20590.1 dithiol-disulfide isomerase [Lentilactobacillus curieae]
MILEIYLFVDPLNEHCYEAEKAVDQVSQKLNKQISVHFIPLLNIAVLNDNDNELKQRFGRTVPYDIILNYKAASFQGQRFGRRFLMNLQRRLLTENENYCSSLIHEIAEESGLDLEMFNEDCQSELAVQTYHSDQRTAAEMNVDEPASAVLFNTEVDDSGILIRNFDYYSLLSFCQNSIDSSDHFKELATEEEPEQKIVQYPDLHSL